jgi:hypothetical protein
MVLLKMVMTGRQMLGIIIDVAILGNFIDGMYCEIKIICHHRDNYCESKLFLGS